MEFSGIIDFLTSFWHWIAPTALAIYYGIIALFVPRMAWRLWLPYWGKIQDWLKKWKEEREAKANLLESIGKEMLNVKDAMTFHETRAKGASDEMRELVKGIKDEVALIKDDMAEIRTEQAAQGGKIEILTQFVKK